MAALDFPASPALNQIFVGGNNVSYKWNGTLWVAQAGGSASIMVSDTPPVTPIAGAMWWNSVLGAMFIYYNDGNTSQWVPTTATPTAQASYLVPITTVFTTPGTATWTPSAKMIYARVQGWGGGGGGGGSVLIPGTATGGGAGGGAGGWAKIIISKAAAGASQTVTIGAAGTAGTAAGGTGGAGGDTSLGVLLIAKGASGGPGMSNAIATGIGIVAGGLGGVAGTGDQTGPGQPGLGNYMGANGQYVQALGAGGSAPPIGAGGRGVFVAASGEAATGFASGGGGATQTNTTGPNRAGGAGTGGYLVIEEYCTP